MASHSVQFQSVTLEIQPWSHPSGREYWRCYYYHPGSGRRMAITRATLPAAKKAVHAKAIELARGAVDFAKLSPAQLRAIRRMLDADPTLAAVDDFLAWHSRKSPKKNLGEALAEFIAVKEANRGRSAQNVKTLKIHLKPLASLAGQIIAEVSVNDLPAIKGAPRTRRNVRAAWVTFFRWCVSREYLPHGTMTAPERLEKPIVRRTVPVTWEPAELRTLLAQVSPAFLPWLACGAFAGTRTDELFPLPGGEKEPLDWSDFHWDREIIIIRPETDKNGHRRVAPILPALKSWLYPIRQDSGPLATASPSAGKYSETARLGKLLGKWKANALRHSFISYRAAIVGLAQTSMECGNSESEARKSYNDAKGADEAAVWFGVLKCSQKTGNQ